jgi:hypothetical protein
VSKQGRPAYQRVENWCQCYEMVYFFKTDAEKLNYND